MADDVAALRLRRDRCRRWAFAGFGMAFFGPFLLRFGNIELFETRHYDDWAQWPGAVVYVGGVLLLGAGLVVFAGAALAWIVMAWRLHKLADPWAYDPELDGPDPNKRHDLDDAFRKAPPGT